MPQTYNTPFGQRIQQDPRDQQAMQRFAIQQHLQQLASDRDAARLNAEAQVRAAELANQGKLSYLEGQQAMQGRRLDADLELARMRQDANLAAGQAEYDRTKDLAQFKMNMQEQLRRQNMSPMERAQEAAQEGLVPALSSGGTIDIDGMPLKMNPLSGKMVPAIRTAPIEELRQNIQGSLSRLGDPTPAGEAFAAPTGFIDALTYVNPVGIGYNAYKGLSNAFFGEEQDITEMQNAFRALIQYYVANGRGDSAHTLAQKAMREQGVSEDIIAQLQ